jgi:hypothetical protein
MDIRHLVEVWKRQNQIPEEFMSQMLEDYFFKGNTIL